MRFRRLRDFLIYVVIFGCIFAIVLSQIYLTMSADSDTEDATLFTTTKSLSFTGVIVRDESLVYTSYLGDGVLTYDIDDGSRVSNGSSIAKIYNSYTQIYNRHEIEKLEEEIEALEKAQDNGTTDYVQPEFISTQISEQYKEIIADIKAQDFEELNSERVDLLKLMCILNVSSNVESDYTDRISVLTERLNNLEVSLVNAVATVTASSSGYFTSVVDGYESDLTTDGISDLTVDEINAIIASPQKETTISSNVIGKLFSDYKWQMVGVIYTDDRYFVNETLEMTFTSVGKTYTVTVESITATGNGNEAIIVLSCDQMDETVAASRVVDVEIEFGTYTGIKASRSAIRFQNGQKGVYVVSGGQTAFKLIDVIYEGDDYVLSSVTSDDSYLSLYDSVLLDPVSTTEGQTSTDSDGDVTEENEDEAEDAEEEDENSE
ncbi:MAG: hypothetical protein LUC38_06935 [Oscillospiraceae bacterium]|nr:hypothetical protein [Oscillospiraceae bacterium]